MANLSDLYLDPTLHAVDAALAARAAEQERSKRRPYLGASAIGGECRRALWYGFRWATQVTFPPDALKRFEDGHRGEALMAQRLRLVDGIQLATMDASTGRQLEVSAFGGHFMGHLDGALLGLLQAPKTWHVWEHKVVAPEKQAKLERLKAELGEKAALERWDPVYFAQAQVYMHATGMKRHYLTCSSPGERTTVSVRTAHEPRKAEALLERARSIVTSAEPPPRLSEKPEHYVCKWCSFQRVCHFGEVPEAHCRTCVHATPEIEGRGRWSCSYWKADEIAPDTQRTGCDQHLFIPALLRYPVVDANAEENWVEYEHEGVRFRNQGDREDLTRLERAYTSAELRHLDPSLIPDIGEARQTFDVRVESGVPSWRRQG